MEDGVNLSPADRSLLRQHLLELEALKVEHKEFAAQKGGLTPEQREKWRLNSQRTAELHLAVKDMRRKNILQA